MIVLIAATQFRQLSRASYFYYMGTLISCWGDGYKAGEVSEDMWNHSKSSGIAMLREAFPPNVNSRPLPFLQLFIYRAKLLSCWKTGGTLHPGVPRDRGWCGGGDEIKMELGWNFRFLSQASAHARRLSLWITIKSHWRRIRSKAGHLKDTHKKKTS